MTNIIFLNFLIGELNKQGALINCFSVTNSRAFHTFLHSTLKEVIYETLKNSTFEKDLAGRELPTLELISEHGLADPLQ